MLAHLTKRGLDWSSYTHDGLSHPQISRLTLKGAACVQTDGRQKLGRSRAVERGSSA